MPKTTQVNYRPPGNVTRAAQIALTLAAIISALVASRQVTKLGIDQNVEMGFMLVANAIGNAATALAFYCALANLRALTGARIMSAWNTIIVGFAPIALMIAAIWLVFYGAMKNVPAIENAASFGGAVIYVGWIVAAIMWPFVWSKLLGVREDGTSAPSRLVVLTVWTAFAVAAASFVAQYLKFMQVDNVTAQIVSSLLQIIGLLINKQMVQDLDANQRTIAQRRGIGSDLTRHRILVSIPIWFLWIAVLLSVVVFTAALTLDANRVFRWF